MPRTHGSGIYAKVIAGPVAGAGHISFELLDTKNDKSKPRPVIATLSQDKRHLEFDAATVARFTDTFRVFSRDGTSTPDEALKNFKPYRPLFQGACAANHAPELLAELGRLITRNTGMGQNSTVPAAYTYFGQFIAHDITRMKVSKADGVFNLRTPTLDLDSLFAEMDAKDQTPQNGVHKKIGELSLGPTSKPGGQEFEDLPRAASGEAQIADARNDHNLGVAQVQVILTKFYHHLVKKPGVRKPKLSFVRHVQWIVLHDYLRRLVDPVTHADVMENGPTVLNAAQSQAMFIPMEFALACFRVGHSMVRDHYLGWSGFHTAFPPDLLELTYNYGCNRLDPFTHKNRLDQRWKTNWGSLLPYDDNGLPHNTSAAIGEGLVQDFRELDGHLVTEILHETGQKSQTAPPGADCAVSHHFNLAVQTLLRGHLYELPDAQTLHKRMAEVAPLTDPLTPAELLNTPNMELRRFLEGPGQDFLISTPLWFYCLRECQAAPANGNRFGPLTGRVVMETVYAAIKNDPQGILGPRFSQSCFVPDAEFLSDRGEFGLREMVRVGQEF